MKLSGRRFTELAAWLLAEQQPFRFIAHGSSMAPAIVDSDVLSVEPCDPAMLEIGEVILYRDNHDRCIAHRLVGRAENTETPRLRLRGDQPGCPLEVIRIDQVMGRVVRVGDPPRIHTRSRTKKAMHCLSTGARQRLALAALHLQGTDVYATLVQPLGVAVDEPAAATESDLPALRRFYGVHHTVGISRLLDGSGFGRVWICRFGRRIAGAVIVDTIDDDPERFPDHWLFSLRVAPLFRRLGLGRELMGASSAYAASAGAERLNLLVLENNRRALALCRSLGFGEHSIPVLDRDLDTESQRGLPRRLLLSSEAS